MKTKFKATPPKLSGPKRSFHPLSCLNWVRKARQCWRMFWNGLGKPPRAKHIKHIPMLGQDLAPKTLPAGWRRWGSNKSHGSGEQGNRGKPGRASQTWETNKKDINNNNKMEQPEATVVLQEAQRQAETLNCSRWEAISPHLKGLMWYLGPRFFVSLTSLL